MSNLTRQQLDEANENIIRVDPDTGAKVVTQDHRDMNNYIIEYFISYQPFVAHVAPNGTITDDRMINRVVTHIIAPGGIILILEDGFNKAYASNIIAFANGNQFEAGTAFVINMGQ